MPRFYKENFPFNVALLSKFESIAKKYDVTTSQIALAWILAKHPDMVPIPGSKSIDTLEDNAKAVRVALKPEDFKALDDAVIAADVRGERRPEMAPHLSGNDCIPLDQWKGE